MIDWKHGAGEGKKEKFYTNQTAKLKRILSDYNHTDKVTTLTCIAHILKR